MKTKLALIWALLLGLGFAGGWLSRSRWGYPPPIPPPLAVSAPVAAKSVLKIPEASIEPLNRIVDRPDPANGQHNQTVSRLNALTGEKAHGLRIIVPVFGPQGVDATFAQVYDLTPTETSLLNEAIKATKEKFNAAAIQNAKAQLSPDGSRLVVEVPTVVDQGGAIYDQLLQSFESILGPDRFQSFNALSGETFDQGFGSFGLWNSRYEVSLATPQTATRDAVYRINLTATGPNGSSSGNFSLNSKGVSTKYPVLAHFIQTGLEPRPGGK